MFISTSKIFEFSRQKSTLDQRNPLGWDFFGLISKPVLYFDHFLDVLDGNNDPLSPGGGTSGPDSGNENGSTNNNNGGKKKKKKGNQGDGRGTKNGKTNWT